jgi:hypothetical protein
LRAAVPSLAGQPPVSPLPQQQQQQRWRSRQRSAQRQFRQLAAMGQHGQQVAADLTAPLLSSSGSSSSRASGSSSSRSQSRGVPIPAHMLPIPQLTPVQSVVSSDGSPIRASGGAL